MYFLKREDGKNVATSGGKYSYTDSLSNTQLFHTREEAQQDACGNEYVVDLDSILDRNVR